MRHILQTINCVIIQNETSNPTRKSRLCQSNIYAEKGTGDDGRWGKEYRPVSRSFVEITTPFFVFLKFLCLSIQESLTFYNVCFHSNIFILIYSHKIRNLSLY